MRASKLLDYIQTFLGALYRSILKLSISAHQVVAYWRTKINRRDSFRSARSPSDEESSTLVDTTTASTNVNLITPIGSAKPQSDAHDTLPIPLQNHSSQQSGLTIKTSLSRRFKLNSILRRLSLRNFMEYCVIALNEASSSSCSNKFDISSCDQPVWLLGRKYELPQDSERLVDDIRSKLWITYRRNFPPIDENTRYTTDRGFGCMIRCGQMVLANALLYKNLGRSWRWLPAGLELNPNIYTKILKLFQDKDQCVYSIHNIVRTGQQEGKLVGEWFGPNTIAQALKRMASTQSSIGPVDSEISISIEAALDNVVVMDEIKARFKQRPRSFSSEEGDSLGVNQSGSQPVKHEEMAEWVPGILFIQLRLGLTKINPLYFAALKKTFQFKNSLGIIGGRPNHALYLIGFTDDDIIYLDPHSTQQYIDFDEISASTNDSTAINLPDQTIEQRFSAPESQPSSASPIDSTYHCACPEKMSIDRLDPSLALCFYFDTEKEFDEWCKQSNDLLIKSEQAPMFEITETRPSHWNIAPTSTIIKSGGIRHESVTSAMRHKQSDELASNQKMVSSRFDGENFTILKEPDEEANDEYELKSVDKSVSGSNSQTNDDEEFEMLG